MEYARRVAAGEQVAGRLVQLACKRHLADLERAPSEFYFDARAGERVCWAVSKFPHVKGELGGQPIHLEPWQCFALAVPFGWRRKRDHARRYRMVYLEVARKNAKTTLASCIGLYLVACDDEPGAVVVSAATTRDQARLCFNDAKTIAEQTPKFRRAFGVRVLANAIVQERSASSFKPLSAEGSHLDGLNIHAAIVDELHAHPTRKVWDVLETAIGARRQPLLWVITTAGVDQYGICYEQRSYCVKVLDGTLADDSVFALIYTLDDGDSWDDRRVWIKANPNLGVSVRADLLEDDARKAAASPASLTNFLTKRLNVWVNADTQWIAPQVWQAAAAGYRAPAAGDTCYVALDLATISDLIALCAWFPPSRAFPLHRVFFRLWIPERALAREENTLLAAWARQGFITVFPGPIQDFEAVADALEDIGATYDVREVAADPWQLPPFLSILNRRSFAIPVSPIRQVVASFTAPMKETEALLLAGKLVHDGNPAVGWMMANVVCRVDANENWRPAKQNKAQKIDAAIALFLAAGGVLRAGAMERGAYEERAEIQSIPAVVMQAGEGGGAGALDELAGL